MDTSVGFVVIGERVAHTRGEEVVGVGVRVVGGRRHCGVDCVGRLWVVWRISEFYPPFL